MKTVEKRGFGPFGGEPEPLRLKPEPFRLKPPPRQFKPEPFRLKPQSPGLTPEPFRLKAEGLGLKAAAFRLKPEAGGDDAGGWRRAPAGGGTRTDRRLCAARRGVPKPPGTTLILITPGQVGSGAGGVKDNFRAGGGGGGGGAAWPGPRIRSGVSVERRQLWERKFAALCRGAATPTDKACTPCAREVS